MNRCGLTVLGPTDILEEVTSGSSSVVEHRLAKARVASSNLVSRSIPPSGASRIGYGRNGKQENTSKRQPCQGAVPKW
jgi:hypothetical protein